ncbi:MAG: amino acid adenylation domain-containing protein [Pseudomonadota bacterium]
MNAAELIAFCNKNSIELNVVDDKLKCKGPKGAITKELLEHVQRNKLEIIFLLKENNDGDNVEARHRPATEASINASFSQQRLWFFDQFEPGSIYHVRAFAMRLSGALDATILERALNEVVCRHQALRTIFLYSDQGLVQVTIPVLRLALPVTDFSQAPSEQCEDEAMRLIQSKTQTPFDLATGPLIRVHLIRLNAHEHILLFTAHHIVCDDWSTNVVTNDIAALYAAFSRGQSSPLPSLALQYVDFVQRQRQWLQGAVLERQLDYWKRQLADASSLLKLPADRPRPPLKTYRGATQEFALSTSVTHGLRTISQQAQATLFMTLVAAFNVLLHRYSGQSDICIGTSTAGRHDGEFDSSVGLFENTLVLRMQIDGNHGFDSLLQRVRDTVAEAYANQNVPFERLVDALQPERHMSHAPLFQVMFILKDAPSAHVDLPGITLRPMPLKSTVALFDLTLQMTEGADQLTGSFEYNTDLFDAQTIARMVNHFMQLLDAIVTDPAARVGDLPLLSAQERQQLLVESSSTNTAYPSALTLHQLFEHQAEQTPDNIALVFEGNELTYASLNDKANQLAHHLHSLGVGPDVLVGLCVERSLDMVIGVLGILKAGGAYVPLDPAYPAERLSYMLDDAQVRVVVTDGTLSSLDYSLAQLVNLQTERDTIALYPTTTPISSSDASNLAYVIYTSGSTGKPNGVLITHACVTRLLAATDTWFGFGPSDVWTLFHSYAFDFSVWELWGALAYGGRVVIVSNHVRRAPNEFLALLVKERVTVLNQTPSAFYQLIDAVDQNPALSQALCLRTVIFGGEKLDFFRLKPWYARYGDTSPRLINMYGITETTVHVTYYPIAAADVGLDVSVIGQKIPDLQVYVLDAALNPVPIGVAGELYVGGAGLARGYLNRPDLTAERFIPHPYQPGQRLYRTGDAGRWQANGMLAYLGRIDHQVKIRGFRIELGEIESALLALSYIVDAAVIVREDMPDDKRLVAYVVKDDDKTFVDVADLRTALQQSLPDYMIPVHFVLLSRLPLTPNGKLDRKALPAPDMVRSDTGYVAPRTSKEEKLTQIWADVLGFDKVGIHDNFFELGGNSLLAIKLFHRMAIELNIKLPLATIFSFPTIADLAAMADTADTERALPSLIVPLRQGKGRRLFCIHPIGGYVFFYQKLAQQLGEQFSVYGIQSPEIAGLPQRFNTIEAMALMYASAIKQAQPNGPYHLLGWSTGGVIAMATAAALEAQGADVKYICLLDSLPVTSVSQEDLFFEAALAMIMAISEHAIDSSAIKGIAHLLRENGIAAQDIFNPQYVNIILPGLEKLTHIKLAKDLFPSLSQQLKITQQHLAMLSGFLPAKVKAPLHFCWAKEEFDHNTHPLGDVNNHKTDLIDGHHYNMLKVPHVQTLSKAIQSFFLATDVT